MVLSGIFLTNAIISEIIGAKMFSLEAVFGFPPAQIPIGSFKQDFNLPAGALPWPIVFITSDIINEYFGPKGVRRISYLGAILITYGFLIIFVSTHLPPAQFWLDVNKGDNNFDINFAFSKIFRQGLNIIVGSITAFLLSQLLDAYVFQYLRNITGSKRIWLRATGSTIISQLIDSYVVIFIAFYVFGNWSFAQVLSTGVNSYLYKVSMALLLTPVLYIAHIIIDKYLYSKSEG
ncbi:queuosine precursor transporter [Cytophagaceae bacterium DM2B3-1]|uniref:Probable queuosine precursor transporter n=1 Tax=Xanthocytophaga flava TaxID=3048013 RepID=A0AAE3UBN4_9BACT|nr:queuosine precursor transporter [Xanthocytophaga flavus]MDJ1472948.1 queuosine precursor transporter [Xanthocytophaga flavus]MDJ1483934.1 queuosine precursor transporter [Xanthocytophaga flavus]MDJ1492373.1 queuosine precursor transporter [Xanthocytophaga flavus]